LLYGMGLKRLAEKITDEAGIPTTEEQAGGIREHYFQSYPGLRNWQNRQGKQRTTRTISGRRRLFKPRKSKFTGKVEYPYTELLNTPIQGNGADGLKLALAKLWETWTPELEGCVPVLTTHDDITIEAPEDKVDQASRWLEDAMVSGMKEILKEVPVEIEITIGRTYGEGNKQA